MTDFANLPTQEGLNALYGSWNPESYARGYQNQDLAEQFRQQAYQQQQNATRKGSLENDQSEQMNPLLLEQRRGLNTQTGLENTSKGIKNSGDQLALERQQANQQNVLNEDQRKAVLAAPQHEIDMMDKQIELGLRNPDPQVRSRALEMQSWLPTIQAARRRAADDIAKIKETSKGHIAGIEASGKNSLALEDQQFEHGKYDRNSKAGFSIEQRIDMENDPAKKMALLIDAANQADQAGDKDSANLYVQRAQALDNLVKMRSAGAMPKAGTLDLGQAAQLPTNPSPSAMPQNGPTRGTAQNPIVLK